MVENPRVSPDNNRRKQNKNKWFIKKHHKNLELKENRNERKKSICICAMCMSDKWEIPEPSKWLSTVIKTGEIISTQAGRVEIMSGRLTKSGFPMMPDFNQRCPRTVVKIKLPPIDKGGWPPTFGGMYHKWEVATPFIRQKIETSFKQYLGGGRRAPRTYTVLKREDGHRDSMI
eukprot:scaffold463195_cov55-Attheya_sp.AAC.1